MTRQRIWFHQNKHWWRGEKIWHLPKTGSVWDEHMKCGMKATKLHCVFTGVEQDADTTICEECVREDGRLGS